MEATDADSWWCDVTHVCLSDLCSPEGAVLQGRLWSTVVSSLDTYYLWGQTFFFCFSSFSSLSFDITLTPHSGSLTGTQEGDQETSPSPKQKQKQTGIPGLVMVMHPFIN